MNGWAVTIIYLDWLCFVGMKRLRWYLLPLFFVVNKSFNIYYSIWILVFFFSCSLSICLSGQVVKLTESLICLSNYRFSHCFLHQVNFTLSYQFHMSVCKRYQHFLLLVCCSSVSSSWNTSNLFCWRKDEKWIWLHAKVEVLPKRRTDQELNICFYFEKVVLLLPNKRHHLKLSQTILLRRCGSILLSGHVVENKLLSPLNYALDNI